MGQSQGKYEGPARVVIDSKSDLGEGAIWDNKRKVLLWVDIMVGKLFEYDPVSKVNKEYEMRQSIGTVVPCSTGGVVACLAKGVTGYDLETKEFTQFFGNPEADVVGTRFNDGKCDPAGRFWFGSLDVFCQKNNGTLYCLYPDGRIESKLTSVRISNGLCWSSDAATMYYIDTPSRKVDAFDFDNATGSISNRRAVVEVPEGLGFPDGMTIDSAGHLWVAMWGGSAVLRFDPSTGELVKSYPIPSQQVTSCAFGGANLDQLYVTSAAGGLTEEEKRAMPLAGGLFVIDLAEEGVSGVPAFEFAG